MFFLKDRSITPKTQTCVVLDIKFARDGIGSLKNWKLRDISLLDQLDNANCVTICRVSCGNCLYLTFAVDRNSLLTTLITHYLFQLDGCSTASMPRGNMMKQSSILSSHFHESRVERVEDATTAHEYS